MTDPVNKQCDNPACAAPFLVNPTTWSWFASKNGIRQFYCSAACQAMAAPVQLELPLAPTT